MVENKIRTLVSSWEHTLKKKLERKLRVQNIEREIWKTSKYDSIKFF